MADTFIPVIPAVSSQPLGVRVGVNPNPSVLSNYFAPPVPFIATGAQVTPSNNPATPNRT